MKSYQKIISEIFLSEKRKIDSRLAEFVEVFRTGNEEQVFSELAFCLFTPQSKAKSCWAAVKKLISKNLILKGEAKDIAKALKGVRFHNNKSKYLVMARDVFRKGKKIEIKSKIKEFKTEPEAREWLVHNIKGLGLKEASHFLRNIGMGKTLAILDRHILKNLKQLNVIKEIPKTISKKIYLDIEKKMAAYAKKVGIPLSHLDLIFWRKQTGEYFK